MYSFSHSEWDVKLLCSRGSLSVSVELKDRSNRGQVCGADVKSWALHGPTSLTFCRVSGVMVKSTGLGSSFPFCG